MTLKPKHISLFQLTNATCKWPFGDGPFTFCGQPSVTGFPYCAHHKALAYAGRPVRRVRPNYDIEQAKPCNAAAEEKNIHVRASRAEARR